MCDYLITENLFWAKSQGYAGRDGKPIGVMEYWSIGVLEKAKALMN